MLKFKVVVAKVIDDGVDDFDESVDYLSAEDAVKFINSYVSIAAQHGVRSDEVPECTCKE